MSFKEIIYTKSEGIATITLNRPHVLNAFNFQMIEEWVSALETAKHDDEVRVVVVTGNGRGFCTGFDMKSIQESEGIPESVRRAQLFDTVQRLPLAVSGFDKPYIAAVNGPAIGAGTDMCSMADIRIASDQAKFAVNHLRVGGMSVDGGYYFLTRVLGVAKTIELAFKYDTFDAAEALRIGLVSSVVPHDELPQATYELASRLAKGAPISMRFAKRAIYQALEVPLEHHLRDVREAMRSVEATEDFQEGRRSTLEKREPIFKGR